MLASNFGHFAERRRGGGLRFWGRVDRVTQPDPTPYERPSRPLPAAPRPCRTYGDACPYPARPTAPAASCRAVLDQQHLISLGDITMLPSSDIIHV